MNLSFAGCGFLGIYHVGVACCFREYAPNVVLPTPDNEVVMSGASAGALTAAGIICNCDLGQATTDTLRVAQKARSRALGPFHPSFKITRILQDGLLYILPDNAHEICDRRLHISLTRVSDGKNVVVNRFSSKDELIQALICSSFVPVWSGFVPPKYRGVRYIDGGLSNNIPIVNEHTVTVCPLAGETDICPDDMSSSFLHLNFAQTSVQMTTENVYRLTRAFFPPHPEVLSAWCKQGFEDALHFLQKTNVISCTRCLTLRTVIPVFRDTTAIRRSSSQTTNHAGSHAAEHSAPVAPSHPPDNCEDCRNFKRHISQTSKGLPTHVSSALQEGIDSQKGLMAYIFRFKAAKALSIMSIPMLLPIDLAYSITWRLVEYAPHLKSDFTWFVGQLASLLLKLMSRINKGRHSYSARLTCQFALTEFHQDDTEESAEHHVARDDQQSRNFGFSVDMEADAMRSAGRIFRNLSQKELTLEASSIVQAAVKVEEEAIAQQRRLAQHDPMVDTYDNYVEVSGGGDRGRDLQEISRQGAMAA
ncbi:PREDICTED: patatin-like phospholipase domain-containing protein 3 [Priapulus caudatus]|uniref:Patatin-like phospholipase domain-containing protein 3 n=1 Tax=Priapulus caudatus TaxID=37621 RepID=A0ABM1E8A2_PRICU|nr:PREDICTED: patatin-like phospholipase domain-containing protein 3 [Priapulus caudatus]